MNTSNQSEAHTIASNEKEQPIRFAGSLLGEKRNICAFFSSEEERYHVMLPFIKEGIERGEKAFHVVNPKLREEHERRMESAGIDVTAAKKSGQFDLCDWENAYFRGGGFDQDRMLSMWQDIFNGAERDGYPRTRVYAKMEWALEDREGVSDLIEYEAKLNLVLTSRNPVICVYDLAKFPGDIILDVMRTHPMIIVGGILQENPFYTPADQFLSDLRERRASRGAAAGSAG